MSAPRTREPLWQLVHTSDVRACAVYPPDGLLPPPLPPPADADAAAAPQLAGVDTPVVHPTLTCTRCAVHFDSATALRRHYRDVHVAGAATAAGGMPAAASSDESGASASSPDSDADRGVHEVEVMVVSEEGSGEEGVITRGGRRINAASPAASHLAPDGSGAYAANTQAGARLVPGGHVIVQLTDTEQQVCVYRALVQCAGDAELARAAADRLRTTPLTCASRALLQAGEQWAVFLLQSGYFAAAVFEVAPLATADASTRAAAASWPRALLHKRCHRYTTRRKQGGSQSAHDAARGSAANSAGAQLRRAGEVQLAEDIAAVLSAPEWAAAIRACRRIVIGAPKTMRVQLYDGKTLHKDDARIIFPPFMTARPSFAEAARVVERLASGIPVTSLLPVDAHSMGAYAISAFADGTSLRASCIAAGAGAGAGAG
ncbi:hypothetical protein EON68_01260, partial [archaeon]